MIRPATSDDVAWMADLMDQRRREHEAWSPVFWKPAPDARAVHEPFLASLVADPTVVALRDDHGFVIAGRDGDRCTVDDFAVDDAGRWSTHGHLLLVAAWRVQRERGAHTARVVSAHRDTAKRDMLLAAGLDVAEEWWVKPLTPAGPATTLGPLDVDGVAALLVPAPPVYDARGPVVVVPPGTDPDRLPAVEERAAAAGAGLAIARLLDDDERAGVEAAGYELASQFLEGSPV